MTDISSLPVGTDNAEAFIDNVRVIDELATKTSGTVENRLGNTLKPYPVFADEVQTLLETAEAGQALALGANLANDTDPLKGAGLVGWFVDNVGFAGRLVRDKLTDVVSVKDYGCVGGDIDEATKLQNALNAASGRALEFAPNTVYRSTNELVVPDGTTLNLNGSTLRFACVGAKRNLAVGSNCKVHNGTVENVIGSTGQEGTYQTPIVLGQYTNLTGVHGVTLDKLTIKTVLPQGNGIAIFADSHDIDITNITFPDSAFIGIPIMAHWSFLESGGEPYVGTTTHPHNIRIKNITCGELTYNAGAGWFGTSVIFLSAAYNVTVENVNVKSVPYGKIITTYAGDWGFQFASDFEKEMGLCGIDVSNITGKALIAVQAYHYNPLEVIKKVWSGNVTFRNINAVSAGGAENKGIRIEGVDNVSILSPSLYGFYNALYFGGTVKNVNIEGGYCRSSDAAGLESQEVASGWADMSISGVEFIDSNTSSLVGTPDIRLHNVDGVNINECVFNSPMATWNVRADNTVTRLSCDKNHVRSVLPTGGPCFSFGSSSDTNIVIHYEGNTSDVSPTNGVRGGQIMVPIATSTRNGTSTILKVVYFDNPPDRGAWNVGDICWNSSPAVGQPKGWHCTVAGTPGTWVSMGNL